MWKRQKILLITLNDMEIFICKIKYEKVQENGTTKKVTEQYLVDTLSFTEAEKRIIDEMKAFISGDFEVADISKVDYSEIMLSDKVEDDKYYNVKIETTELTDNGNEKKIPYLILVLASNIDTAKKHFDKEMEGSLMDCNVVSIKETKILDYYKDKE